MKRKLIEKYPPLEPFELTGKEIRVQAAGEILILDIWETGLEEQDGKKTAINKLTARHLVNVETGEHETYNGKWSKTNIYTALDIDYYYCYYAHKEDDIHISKGDEKLIYEYLPRNGHDTIDIIASLEWHYNDNRRMKTEENRQKRIEEIMDEVGKVPKGLAKDIMKAAGWEHHAIREKGSITCTACGNYIDIPKVKDRELIKCPACGKKIRYLSRKKKVRNMTRFLVIEKIESGCVARYFKARQEEEAGGEGVIDIIEEARLIIPKNGLKPRSGGNLYLEQWMNPFCVEEGKINSEGWFDNKKNAGIKRLEACYLREKGIDELSETIAEPWIRILKSLAKDGYKLNYLNILQATDKNYISLIEMLYKGRFYSLMKAEIGAWSTWRGTYEGSLNIYGKTIEGIFKIDDRQRINQIRSINGNVNTLYWMRFSDKTGVRIKDDTLKWLKEEQLTQHRLVDMLEVMTLEQIKNYITRQQAESYKGKEADEVVNQYYDYINMCKKLGKDTTDEMIYRPRELKRRHDEAVAEIEFINAKADADKYSERYSEAEDVLKEIKDKLEYNPADSDYFITVPKRIIDIVTEGRCLHHCVGSTDRYFDRIKQRETYICFLRKKSEPNTPFYTIEVEPGGTVRQHRGMYDEEPEFDKVGTFIKRWQHVIKKRMTEEDRHLAKKSEKARNDNMEELIRANNTRVIKGLLEDLMEVS